MTIEPKDLRTLLIRLALVTIALRAAPMFTADLGPSEAAAALGLAGDGVSSEPWLVLARIWNTATAGQAGLLRLTSLAAELSLPLLAVGYARVAGWGTLPGLIAGLALALAPWTMQAGHRFGAGGLVAAGALLALLLLHGGLKERHLPRIAASGAVVLLLGLLASPALVIVPAGLYGVVRSLVEPRIKVQATAAWLLAAVLGLAGRLATVGYVLPQGDAATSWWGAAQAGENAGWASTSPLLAAGQLLECASPLGPQGALARLLDGVETPLIWLVAGAAVVLLAAVGTWRGLVQADPPVVRQVLRSPLARDDDEQGGAAARDGWQTLGVALPNLPRALGDRDWAPPLVAALGAAAVAGWLAQRGTGNGVVEALAVARIGVALPLGAGLAALALPAKSLSESSELLVKRRAYWTLGAVALALFAVGAWHLLAQTERVDRIAARKVARFARDSAAEMANGSSAFLAVGPRGLAVASQLDPLAAWPRLRRAQAEAGDAAAHLTMLLQQKPGAVLLLGDRAALGADAEASPDQLAVLRTLDKTLKLSGFVEVDDSHRQIGATAVIAYQPAGVSSGDPRTVRPQLAPGVAP